MPAMTGMRKPSMRLRKTSSRRRSKTGWVMAYSRAGLDFVVEAAQFVLDVGHAGIGGDADGEVGAGADGVGADVEAVVEAADDVDQADGVDVEDGSCVRIVAQLGRIAGEAEDVVQADGRGAEQVRLNAEDIAIAAGVVENGFDAGVLLNLDAEALRAHARRGAGRVGHVDGVDAELRQDARALDLLGAVDAAGRNDFDQGDEAALLDERRRCGSAGPEARAASRCSGDGLAPATWTRVWASMARMAERMARMWLGVVPQQPPTICAPAAMALRAKLAMYSGEQR